MKHFAFEYFPDPVFVFLNDEHIYSNLKAEENKDLVSYMESKS